TPPSTVASSLRLVEHLLWRHRHDPGIGRDKVAALDQLYEFGPELARDEFPDAPVLVDVGPFADQVEMVGVGGVAAQHAVLDLRPGAAERGAIAVIERVEQLDELVAATGLHPEIVDVEIVAPRGQRDERHLLPPLHPRVGFGDRRAGTRPGTWRTRGRRLRPMSPAPHVRRSAVS